MVSATRTFTRPPGDAPTAGAGPGTHEPWWPPASDPRVPLTNLAIVGQRVDSVRRFLADSLDRHADIGGDKLQAVSSEIASAVQQIILNGAALLAFSQTEPPPPPPPMLVSGAIPPPQALGKPSDPDLTVVAGSGGLVAQAEGRDAARSADRGVDLTAGLFPAEETSAPEETKDRAEEEDNDGGDYEIVEMDAVELLAEHVHFCEICGKGFKRDANLRMHMRAHGNQFKTLEALSKPEAAAAAAGDPTAPVARKRRFSCPFLGCNRNRSHKRFRPMKSAVCVKNHFRRSHCPKIYSCTRCNKKSFSVLADLKSHLKHCGECRWRCSCGTSFSRKDKLFGHMALFEGHMPAVPVGVAAGEVDDVDEKVQGLEEEEVEEEFEEEKIRNRDSGFLDLVSRGFDPEFFEELMVDELGTVDGSVWIDF